LAFFVDLTDTSETRQVFNQREDTMGLLDRLLGRGKKAMGDMTGSSSMKHEDEAHEHEGAEGHGGMAQDQSQQPAETHTERENM
jgi:hypothetical protein